MDFLDLISAFGMDTYRHLGRNVRNTPSRRSGRQSLQDVEVYFGGKFAPGLDGEDLAGGEVALQLVSRSRAAAQDDGGAVQEPAAVPPSFLQHGKLCQVPGHGVILTQKGEMPIA